MTHLTEPDIRDGSAPAAQEHGTPRSAYVLAVLVGAAAVAAMCWSGLNHDVRYCLGGMRAAGRGGIPASGTFIHRPLAYRWLLSGLDHLTTGPVALREAWIRLVVIVLTAAVIWWLRGGLARYLARREAGAVAAGIGLTLLFAPAWDFLQPEWFAVWLAVAGLAAGTALRRLRYAVPAAGVLIALAVLVKYTTAPTALLPLGALIAMDRRRGWWTAVAAAVATPAGFVLAIAVQPREWRWFNELSALNPSGPLQNGFHTADLAHLVDTVGTEALMNPLVALLPAAVVLLARGAATRRERWAWPLVTATGVAGVLVALIVQGQWFQYHLAALPVLAAALWGLVLARSPHRWLVAAALLLGVAVPLLAGQSLAWRSAHAPLAFALVSVVAAAALCVAFRPAEAPPRYAAAVATVLALSIPVWPTTPYSYDTRHSTFTALERVRDRQDLGRWLDGVRERIGPDTPVTYLAFGDVGYQLGNPTHCRYPTPDFLQRTLYDRDITSQASYRENLRCVADPTARFAVLDTWWFPLSKVAPEVSAAIRARYDCASPVATDPAFHLVVCPRR
ncbi:ArnT family glycosyltransferase [Streptomyces polygonati]|uniref:ArnT family glycosyltransferase n=1 Tax=Streptomyces polygonati TaxID=1617087 RepID=A0ABV8HP83_9ACTN